MKAFISYSHADEAAVGDLHKHLAAMRRAGQIDAWFDREILAGENLDSSIISELSSADIFFAMISPDFINSDYCFEKEMVEALKGHDEGTIRVIPIILEPCDWQNTPLGDLKAVPKDGKAISEWTNKNTAWLDVVNEIKRVISSLSKKSSAASFVAATARDAPEKKYRIERDFDAIDKSDYREKAFATISEYFQEASAELDEVEGMKARFRRISDVAFSCSAYNRMTAKKEAHITVRLGGANSSFGDISYVDKENDTGNSANGWFSINADKYDMYLSNSGMTGFSNQEAKRLTPKAAAEFLWNQFIQRAGVSYE
ncbi:MAG: molecular chaperone Tir [Parvularcula sp.]|nr:molecular chaperone Tir [Parvularcula sp.]